MLTAFDRAATAAVYRARINASPVSRFQISLVVAVLLVLVIDGLDLQLLGLVAPVIVAEWGLDNSQFGVALSAALVGMSVGTVVGGSLGDRLGRMPVLLGSTLLFGVATIISGMADNVPILTALRLLSGLGFGAAAPNGVALVSDWLPDRLRPQFTSLLSIGTPAGGMVGAVLVLNILPYTDWRVTFYVCGALTFLLATGIVLFVRESALYHLARGRADLAKASLEKYLKIAAPDVVAKEAGQPSATRAIFGFLDRPLIRLNIGAGSGFFALSFVSYAFIAWTPLMLSSVGFAVDQAVIASFAFNLSAMGAALIGGLLMARFGTKNVLASAATALFGSLAMLGMLLASYHPQSGAELPIYVLVGASGGFAGMGMASLYTIMAIGYPSACRAGGLGFGLMLGRVGGILASFVGGYLIDIADGGLWPLILVLLACSLIAGLGNFISDRHALPRQ
jgi:AAHS family 4-hydroxybenzoate transporter-like MFS transporter